MALGIGVDRLDIAQGASGGSCNDYFLLPSVECYFLEFVTIYMYINT